MSINSQRPIANGVVKDVLLELKDSGLVAVSAAAQVGGQDKILDLGLGKFRADVIIDASAVEVDTDDERYTIITQFSTSDTFASNIVNGTTLYLGSDGGALANADTGNVEGRYKLPFTNIIDDVHYQYMRLFTIVSGTIATGIDYEAFVTIR